MYTNPDHWIVDHPLAWLETMGVQDPMILPSYQPLNLSTPLAAGGNLRSYENLLQHLRARRRWKCHWRKLASVASGCGPKVEHLNRNELKWRFMEAIWCLSLDQVLLCSPTCFKTHMSTKMLISQSKPWWEMNLHMLTCSQVTQMHRVSNSTKFSMTNHKKHSAY